MNKVILMGRLTKDPEIRISPETGIKVASYTLAVGRTFGKGQTGKADFFRCCAFRMTADFAEKYLHKGQKIVIVGHLQTSDYINKEGEKVNAVTVGVESQEFCERLGEERDFGTGASEDGSETWKTVSETVGMEIFDETDLPF